MKIQLLDLQMKAPFMSFKVFCLNICNLFSRVEVIYRQNVLKPLNETSICEH